jgi:hypothetical protein
MRAINWLLKKVVKVRLEGPIDIQMYATRDADNKKYLINLAKLRLGILKRL